MQAGAHALDHACVGGHREVMELLLAHDPQLLELPGGGEHTSLMVAAGFGHADLVDRLLALGADPRRQLEDGERALDWASQEGHLAAVERLLAHDPTLVDLPGYRGRTALGTAARNGHGALVSLLLACGADPRHRHSSGARALDRAAQEGHLDVVERLLAHDPGLLDLPGSQGDTPLIMAAGHGHVVLVRLLLDRGADARHRNEGGLRALDWAAQTGLGEVAGVLLAHDPELLDLPGFHERTALAAAAGGGHTALVADLLGRGADPSRRLADGTRALDWAASQGHQAVVERLLSQDPGLLDLPGYH
jgi:ankyrin repeat protein